MFQSDLFVYLAGNDPLAKLVGSRIFPTRKPPAKLDAVSYPCVTYSKVSGPRDHTMEGVGGMVSARYQFNCWAKKYADAQAVADALRGALDNFRGLMGASRVHGSFLQDEADILPPDLAVGTDLPLGVRQDYAITHNE